MSREKLKIVICLAAALCLLLAPIFLVVNSNGVAHAKKPPGQIGKPGKPSPGHIGPPPHASSPEPATWLLIGSGAAGLVLLRKKLKK